MKVKLKVSHRTGSGWKGSGETVTLHPNLAQAMIDRDEAEAVDEDPRSKAKAAAAKELEAKAAKKTAKKTAKDEKGA